MGLDRELRFRPRIGRMRGTSRAVYRTRLGEACVRGLVFSPGRCCGSKAACVYHGIANSVAHRFSGSMLIG
jgi:hypothetical protein